MSKYWDELKGKKLPEAKIKELPRRCWVEDFRGNVRLVEPYAPSEWLKNHGFPAYIYNNPIQHKPLPELDTIEWKRFMLITGDYRVGKTTLAANCMYWRGYQRLSRKEEVMLDRFDTAELTEILCMADKDFDGLPSACDRHTGGEQSGEELQYRIENILENSWGELLILDDFNLDALSNDAQVKKVNQLVMGRCMNNQPTWLITNESIETMEAKFPRLMSRVTAEENWGLLEKAPFVATL